MEDHFGPNQRLLQELDLSNQLVETALEAEGEEVVVVLMSTTSLVVSIVVVQ